MAYKFNIKSITLMVLPCTYRILVIFTFIQILTSSIFVYYMTRRTNTNITAFFVGKWIKTTFIWKSFSFWWMTILTYKWIKTTFIWIIKRIQWKITTYLVYFDIFDLVHNLLLQFYIHQYLKKFSWKEIKYKDTLTVL